MPDDALPVFKEKYGRPCPRILLHPKNQDAWELVNLLLNPYTSNFGGSYAVGLAHFYEPEEYRRLIRRVRGVMVDKDFLETISDARERAEKEGGSADGVDE